MATLLKSREVAERLGVTERTVRRYVLVAHLPAIRLSNRAVRFDPQALDAWLLARAEAS